MSDSSSPHEVTTGVWTTLVLFTVHTSSVWLAKLQPRNSLCNWRAPPEPHEPTIWRMSLRPNAAWANRWEEVSCGRPPGYSRLPSHSGKERFTAAALEESRLQHLDTHDTKAWLAVTVANLKGSKSVSRDLGKSDGQLYFPCWPGCEDIVEQKIRPKQAGGLTGPDYSPQL